MDIADCFYIGYISRTRGLKGELQLFFEFDDYEALGLDTLFLEVDGKLVPFFVESVNLLPNRTAYLFFEDVDHLDKAKPLVRKKVFLPNALRPERDPDDFRMADLQGFYVYDRVHGALGEITEVNEYPQQHVATVRYRGHDVLFPLTDGIIVSIDRQARRMDVALPEGLVELYCI